MHERQQNHILSSYFAPRGHQRMYALGMQLAPLYLSPFDKLIGIIGEAGSGKSALIRGMFPGLELTNDDDGVYVRPLPLLELDSQIGFFEKGWICWICCLKPPPHSAPRVLAALVRPIFPPLLSGC